MNQIIKEKPRAKGKYQKWLKHDNLILLEAWARNGLTDEQIAHNMGINVATLYRWKQSYCDICNALKSGKEIVDIIMENALYERGLGGVHEVKKTFKVKHSYYDDMGRKCEKEELVSAIDEVYVPGDTTAQIFWLKNRKPEEWRDRVHTDADTAELSKVDDLIRGIGMEANR